MSAEVHSLEQSSTDGYPLRGIPKRCAMSGDHPIGDRDDLLAAGVKRLLLPRDGIGFRSHVVEPPAMRSVRRCLRRSPPPATHPLRYARSTQDVDARGHGVAIHVVAPPVAFVHCPKVHDFGMREQGNVDRMIGVMVTDKHVRHLVRSNALVGKAYPPSNARSVTIPGSCHNERMLTPDRAQWCPRHDVPHPPRRRGSTDRPSMALMYPSTRIVTVFMRYSCWLSELLQTSTIHPMPSAKYARSHTG